MRDQEPPAAAADGQGPGPNALMGRRPGVGGEAGGDNSAIRADTASNGAGAEPPPAAATRAQTETAFSSWLGGSSRSLGAGRTPLQASSALGAGLVALATRALAECASRRGRRRACAPECVGSSTRSG